MCIMAVNWLMRGNPVVVRLVSGRLERKHMHVECPNLKGYMVHVSYINAFFVYNIRDFE